MAAPAMSRPRVFRFAAAGAAVGLVILVVRLATLPESRVAAVVLAIGGALLLIGGVAAVGAVALRRRMRAASVAFPRALLIPVTVGAPTVVATRWLAEHAGDPGLRLEDGSRAILAVDGAGLHVLGGAGTPGHLPAAAVAFGRAERGTLVFDVTIEGVAAPLPVVPLRARSIPTRLTDVELLAVAARVEAALAGRPVEPGWPF